MTGPTLIVSPLSVLQTWCEQIQEHTDGSLRVYVYHGGGRTKNPAVLMLYDIVLTTYSVLSSEFIPEVSSLLHCVKWSRIVLDEAHLISNRKTLQSMAVVELDGTHRWAITGTPIQNKLEDIFPLFSFLRLHPLDTYDYFQRLILLPLRQRNPTSLVSGGMERGRGLRKSGVRGMERD
ncbi:hypothetical protein GUITHDRAFT_66606 [Guillardia theta CCMP2712]|uniref:Helicase ATP-binding domain-containing protein n=1 Tax=Guillardia theta (strain CCMP2712) TaxID=905079 RepID=L1JRH4_GUITC|nr:hypothetical protein GUITHDRAFT_66606 [Guillardia theta CCMP2712]EKX50884.1 hypothetical protein GUITHDRAFT_66606 [Guillardia theta CCMP2712]|eukprot:XP_005837864.1 hypothetical protein GUITHDRAFT_66606 [Guillardia theta CCMP2712]